MTFRSNKKSLFTMLSVHLVWCPLGSNETGCWLLETGRCPSCLKQQAYSSPAVRAFAKSNKCLIHFKGPIVSVSQGPVTAVALQPFQRNKVTALGSHGRNNVQTSLDCGSNFHDVMSGLHGQAFSVALETRNGKNSLHHPIISRWWQTLSQFSCPVPVISLEGGTR